MEIRSAHQVEYHRDFQPFDPKFALIGDDLQIVTNVDLAAQSLKSLPREEMLSIAFQTYNALNLHRSPENSAPNVLEFVLEKGVSMFETQILTPKEIAEIKKKVDAPDVYGDNIMRLGWH